MAASGAAIKVVPVSIAVEGWFPPDDWLSAHSNHGHDTYGDVDALALDHHGLKWDSPVITVRAGDIDKIDLTRVERRVHTTNDQQPKRTDVQNDLPKGQRTTIRLNVRRVDGISIPFHVYGHLLCCPSS
jgi:hypothetical protein